MGGQYYPTCRCQQYYSNMCYNPHGYYYAPANLYYPPAEGEIEGKGRRRNKKRMRKKRAEERMNYHEAIGYEKHGKKHRNKSAYVNNWIPLQIFPTRIDNKTLLHAYPLCNDVYPPYMHPGELHECPNHEDDRAYRK